MPGCREAEAASTTSEKAAWRARAHVIRRTAPWRSAEDSVLAPLRGWLAASSATTVLLYLALADEIDVAPLAAAPGLAHHRWATVRTPPQGPLTLHPLDAPRERHRLGFEQPAAGAAELAPDTVGVVLVPGLAFAHDGARLGRGGGYYDRLLATTVCAVSVGVTLEALVLDGLPTEDHDRRVDYIATERGIVAAESAAPVAVTVHT